MFRPFRTFIAAIYELVGILGGINGSLRALIDLQSRDGASGARLEELERSRALWESEMKALVATATGKYEASNNAEARTRTMKRHYEKLVDPFDEEIEEVAEAVPASDDPGGAAHRLLQVPVVVAANHKANALRFKYGRQ